MFKTMHDTSKIHRELKTRDIVRRMGVITANRVHLKKYPIDNPITILTRL